MYRKEFSKELCFKDVMELRTPSQPREKILVLSNRILYPFLEKYLLYYGEDLQVSFLNYEKALQEKVTADAALFIWDLREQFIDAYDHIYEMTREEREQIVRRATAFLDDALSGMRRMALRITVWSFEKEEEGNLPYGQYGFNTVIDEANAYLLSMSMEHDFLDIIDSNALIRRIGSQRVYDIKKKYLFSMPYTQYMYNCMAYTFLKHLRWGDCKKCLVLDCDNVLWGGTIRDDGIEGIQISNQFVGRAYRDFQREVIKLFYQGVLICLCSKNDLSDVKEIVERHPDFLLRDRFIASYKISDNNKADAIRELAGELNLTLDSIVFVDDSAYEIGLVARELPEVTGILLDAKRPETFAEIIKDSFLFSKKKISILDQKRTSMYKERTKRREGLQKVTNLEAYLSSLKQNISIEKINEFSFGRVVELSRRTNQFNLSNLRLDDARLREFLADPQNQVYTLRLSDSYGDMGIVAAAMLSYTDCEAVIRAMFLSCRAFDRGCEEALLAHILQEAKKRGAGTICGCFSNNGKNERFRDFYVNHDIKVLQG